MKLTLTDYPEYLLSLVFNRIQPRYEQQLTIILSNYWTEIVCITLIYSFLSKQCLEMIVNYNAWYLIVHETVILQGLGGLLHILYVPQSHYWSRDPILSFKACSKVLNIILKISHLLFRKNNVWWQGEKNWKYL